MQFEHFALNVPDARAMAAWYVNELGLRIAVEKEGPPFVAFLADDTERVMMELYTNPAASVPDYRLVPPLNFHFAFVADEPLATRARLERAGATVYREETLADGSLIVTMRDPWGVPFQLCRRTKPF